MIQIKDGCKPGIMSTSVGEHTKKSEKIPTCPDTEALYQKNPCQMLH